LSYVKIWQTKLLLLPSLIIKLRRRRPTLTFAFLMPTFYGRVLNTF